MAKYALNPKASSFYDPTIGLKILPDQVVEITSADLLRSKRLKAAINSGHLQQVSPLSGDSKQNQVKTVEEKLELFKNLYQKGKTTKDLVKKFSESALIEILISMEYEEDSLKELKPIELVETIISELEQNQ